MEERTLVNIDVFGGDDADGGKEKGREKMSL